MPSQAKGAQPASNSRAAAPTLAAEKSEVEPAEDKQRLMRRNALANYGFNPKSDGRFPITNGLVNQIRRRING